MKYYLNQHFDEGFFVTVEPFNKDDLYHNNIHIPNSKSSWADGISGPVEIPEELYQEYLSAKCAVDVIETKIFELFYKEHKVKNDR